MIAALFVQTGGAYFGLPNIDPWDIKRDARLYAGPHRVIAHPPCQRWGRYWNGGPSTPVRLIRGDDHGCFKTALDAVRLFGGVLEHPAVSSAWRTFGLNNPPFHGGWVYADFLGGWTCHVDQGHYGHRARKPTWLYAHGGRRTIELPSLIWGESGSIFPMERLSKRQRAATPAHFRELLIAMVTLPPA